MTNQAIKIISAENGTVRAEFFGGKEIEGSSIDAFMPYLEKTHCKVNMVTRTVTPNVPAEIIAALESAFIEANS